MPQTYAKHLWDKHWSSGAAVGSCQQLQQGGGLKYSVMVKIVMPLKSTETFCCPPQMSEILPPLHDLCHNIDAHFLGRISQKDFEVPTSEPSKIWCPPIFSKIFYAPLFPPPSPIFVDNSLRRYSLEHFGINNTKLCFYYKYIFLFLCVYSVACNLVLWLLCMLGNGGRNGQSVGQICLLWIDNWS